MERSSSSSSSSSDQVKTVDWISKLPGDVLLMILSRLSTEEAIRTSVVSIRWKHVWKQMSHLVFDMRRIIKSRELRDGDGSDRVATLITKVINNYRGHLESCVITHFPYQALDGMLNTWILSLTFLKRTKVLTLECYAESMDRTSRSFDFFPSCFSHPSLTSLSLKSYILESSDAFINCSNLRTLKLSSIRAPEVGVINSVLASCPSLVVLVLDFWCRNKSGGPLKIENNKLELLQVSTVYNVDGIKVSETSLDILAIIDSCLEIDKFFLQSPQLQFNRNYWVANRLWPHISYNISKEKSIGHEEFVNICGELLRPRRSVSASLSVCVDLMNRTEVERLRQLLCLWTHKMKELEIKFKENNAAPREENESWQKMLWEDNSNKDPFPNADFRVKTVWMHNFSGSEEEFALASCLIRQGTVLEKMMIKSMSFPARKKLNIEAAVAELQALQTEYQREVTIECF